MHTPFSLRIFVALYLLVSVNASTHGSLEIAQRAPALRRITPEPEPLSQAQNVVQAASLPKGCREPYPFPKCTARRQLTWHKTKFEACGVYRGESCAAFCRGLIPGAPPCRRRYYLSDILYAHCMTRCLEVANPSVGSCREQRCFSDYSTLTSLQGAVVYVAKDRFFNVRSHSIRFERSSSGSFRARTRVNCIFFCWRRLRCPRKRCSNVACCRRRRRRF